MSTLPRTCRAKLASLFEASVRQAFSFSRPNAIISVRLLPVSTAPRLSLN